MKRLLTMNLLGVALCSGALADADQRTVVWCEDRKVEGEAYPPPRLNLPRWACDAAQDAKLHAKYRIYSTINPFYLSGDFNGDGKPDVAVWVAERKSSKLGLVILHRGAKRPIVLGAGVNWAGRGDDFAGLDMWTILPRGSQLLSAHENDREVLLRSDAIEMIKSESASFTIYWSGKSYVSYQTGD